jgi:hypothetical protein
MKMSKMIIDFASEYIAMGDTLEKKQSDLNAACTAWNIAILSKHQRKKALKKYLESFKRYNPHQRDTAILKHDMLRLIKRKNELFPDVKKFVANAEIRENDGKYSIAAASANLDSMRDFPA